MVSAGMQEAMETMRSSLLQSSQQRIKGWPVEENVQGRGLLVIAVLDLKVAEVAKAGKAAGDMSRETT